jgi:class 3 adenylate cyclase
MDGAAGTDPRSAGLAAYDRHEWQSAYDRLTAADRDAPLAGADLARLAEAARWTARADEVIPLLERAAERFSAEGDRPGAAGAALALAREHWQRGDTAVAAGCVGRAGRLLDGLPECPEQGLLSLMMAKGLIDLGDAEQALALARSAIDIGARTSSRDVEALGLLWEGHALLLSARFDEGRARLDEANAAAAGGGLGIDAAGTIFCSTLVACRNVGDWVRAGEWTQVSLRWCERQNVNGFPGLCRFHRAEVMRVHGSYAEAEIDVRAAIDELLVTGPRYAGWGYRELGELRRRRGDDAGAAASFARALELGTDPQPGFALLELDRGNVDAAVTSIRRGLGDDSGMAVEERPWILPVAVTVELAAGHLDEARSAALALRELADACATPATRAAAAGAEGEVSLATGELEQAVQHLEAAWRLWCEVDAPYEAAQTRVLLARAHHERGDRESAALDLEAAAGVFERLGARRALQRVRRVLGEDASGARTAKVFMFTDIVESTRLLEAMGDAAWQNLLAWHDRTLRACLSTHGGTEVKHEGDGFFVVFERADDALDCAVAIQRALAEHRQAHGFAPPVRIGVHAAEATERSGDYFGRGVHEAARVAGVAGGGEILASGPTLAGASSRFAITERRQAELKGLPEPVEVVTVDWG